jgi:hypothetical protein
MLGQAEMQQGALKPLGKATDYENPKTIKDPYILEFFRSL